MNDIAVRLEHVDLLDSLDGLSVELLQGQLELLVIGTRAGGSTLDLAARGTLSTRVCVSCEFGEHGLFSLIEGEMQTYPTLWLVYHYEGEFSQLRRTNSGGGLAELLEALLDIRHDGLIGCGDGAVKDER